MYYYIFLLLLVLLIEIKSTRSVGFIRSSHLTPTFTSQPLDSSQQQYWVKYILTNLVHASFTITSLCLTIAHSSWRDSFFLSQSFLVIHPILQHSFNMWTLYLPLIPYTYHRGKGRSAKGFIAPNLDIRSTDIYNWDSQVPFIDNWQKQAFSGHDSFSLF